MEKKIFFFDIDGTLYDPGLKAFPPSTCDVLRQLFAQGHLLYIATSRSREELENVRAFIERFPFHGFLHTDGAVVQCGENEVSTEFLPEEDAFEVMEFCQREGILVRWQSAEGLYFNMTASTKIIRAMDNMFGYIPKVRIWQREPLLRIAAYAPTNIMLPVCRISNRVSCLPLSPYMSTITKAGVEKGSAMSALVKREGMSLSQAVAFGDGLVDQKMLLLAGIGIAMGDSPESVKNCADYVTNPVSQGGILQACRNFRWL